MPLPQHLAGSVAVERVGLALHRQRRRGPGAQGAADLTPIGSSR